jgi:hypothetical protein
MSSLIGRKKYWHDNIKGSQKCSLCYLELNDFLYKNINYIGK